MEDYDYTDLLMFDEAIRHKMERLKSKACCHCAEAAWAYNTKHNSFKNEDVQHIVCFCRLRCDVLYDTLEEVDELAEKCSGRHDPETDFDS